MRPCLGVPTIRSLAIRRTLGRHFWTAANPDRGAAVQQVHPVIYNNPGQYVSSNCEDKISGQEEIGLPTLPQSQLGKACGYLLNHWDVLVAHQQHSLTRLDNNLVENAIRPTAIGKKNWLFIGHPDAGQRSAIIYSLVISCQRHGKDPLAYLRDVLGRLPSMTNQDDLTPLTPAAWQPA